MAQVHMPLESGAWSLLHMLRGTTPNMAPPSSLKSPVSIVCNFMIGIKDDYCGLHNAISFSNFQIITFSNSAV
jgi:hypothetical protein